MKSEEFFENLMSVIKVRSLSDIRNCRVIVKSNRCSYDITGVIISREKFVLQHNIHYKGIDLIDLIFKIKKLFETKSNRNREVLFISENELYTPINFYFDRRKSTFIILIH